MTENLKESSKSQQKKNVFTKIRENIDDKDELISLYLSRGKACCSCLEWIYSIP